MLPVLVRRPVDDRRDPCSPIWLALIRYGARWPRRHHHGLPQPHTRPRVLASANTTNDRL